PTPDVSTPPLHDALPISDRRGPRGAFRERAHPRAGGDVEDRRDDVRGGDAPGARAGRRRPRGGDDVRAALVRQRGGPGAPRRSEDRKSTRLNSSHVKISY